MTTREYNSNPMAEGFRAELAKVWTRRNGTEDTKMVDYCIKSADELIKLSNGMYFATDTPSIKTDFCFGYHTDYSGHEHSDAEAERKNFKESGERFKASNLEGLDSWIEGLTNRGETYYLRTKYICGGNIAAIESVCYWMSRPKDAEDLPEADRLAIIEAFKRTREKFEKRLDAYLKRYGTSKLHTWTYWIDE